MIPHRSAKLAAMENRNFSFLDTLIINADQAIRTLAGRPLATERPNPADSLPETELSEQEQELSARLMRVNHAGEVAAQALYQGQAITARLTNVRSAMEKAAREENDHLVWCQQRITELNSHVSYANPLWYAGSFAIGAAAGIAGDKWSLGFVAETEHQVTEHLDTHLHQLSLNDTRSRAIIEQMKTDEQNHGETAKTAGGAELPGIIKSMMKMTSKIMTSVAYRF